MLVSLLVKKNINLSLPSKDLIYLAILGFMGVTFHNLIQAEALKTAQAATSAWIVSTTPVIIALLGWMFLKEKIAKTGLIGLFSAALGVLMVLGEGSSLMPESIRVGDILISLSAVNWAAFTVFSRKFLGEKIRSSPFFMSCPLVGFFQTSPPTFPACLFRFLGRLGQAYFF